MTTLLVLAGIQGKDLPPTEMADRIRETNYTSSLYDVAGEAVAEVVDMAEAADWDATGRLVLTVVVQRKGG